MKAKIEVSISIVLMVVILATILSLSFAWFSASNPNAYATNGQFNAAETESADANVNISTVIDYGGETGVDLNRGALDYPYKAFYTFTISFRPLNANVCVTNDISSVSIKLSGETEPSINSVDNPEITKHFSWDLYLVKSKGSAIGSDTTINEGYSFFPAWVLNKEGNDWYYKDGSSEAQSAAADYEFTHYYPSECFKNGNETITDSIIRDINGKPLKLNHIGITRSYTFVIEITFLDRASYCSHCVQSGLEHPADCENRNSSINEFVYSNPDYMNCRFSLGIDIGFKKMETIIGGGSN